MAIKTVQCSRILTIIYGSENIHHKSRRWHLSFILVQNRDSLVLPLIKITEHHLLKLQTCHWPKSSYFPHCCLVEETGIRRLSRCIEWWIPTKRFAFTEIEYISLLNHPVTPPHPSVRRGVFGYTFYSTFSLLSSRLPLTRWFYKLNGWGSGICFLI
jgi:hypothetical protein